MRFKKPVIPQVSSRNINFPFIASVNFIELNIQLRMLSQSNYLCGIKGNEGNHLTNILSPYEFLMMRTPEPELLRKGKVPSSLLKQRKIQRTDHKVPILQWFTALTGEERKQVAEIQNEVIVEMAVRLAGTMELQSVKVSVDFSRSGDESSIEERFKMRMFDGRSASIRKIEAERLLVESVRVVSIGRPALYLTTSFLENPQRCLDCLSQISEGHIFKSFNNSTGSQQFANPLWFSCYSFNTFGEWVCSSLQEIILKRYQNSLKLAKGGRVNEPESSALTIADQFIKFSEKIQNLNQSKNQNSLRRWVQLKITDSNYKQIQQAREKYKSLWVEFQEHKTKELWDNIDYVPTGRKKARKVAKKKRVEVQEVELVAKEEVLISTVVALVEQKACLLTKDTSGVEIKETIECMSGDISMISEIVCNEIEPHIKKQSSEIYFVDEKIQLLQAGEEEPLIEMSEEVQQKIEQPTPQHALSHSTSDSLQQKKRKRHNKRSRRRIPEELIDYVYTEWCETGLQSFVDSLSIESNKLFEARLVVFQRIRNLVMKLHGQYTVDAKLFGSCSVGLALPTSDIDILLTGFNLQNQLDCTELLQKLSVQLRKMKWTVDCTIYPTAKVPIIKVSVNPNIHFLSCYAPQSEQFAKLQTIQENLEINKPVNEIIKIDITIEVKNADYSHLGFKSTEFMKSNIETTQYLHPVVIILKYLLSEKKLNKPFKGGLSSFGLLILCSAYMKTYPNYKSLSQAFLNLLEYYSSVFDGDKQSITLYQNCPCFTQRLSLENIPSESGLCIIDPLSGRIMTANCSGFYLIKYQFRRLFSTITKVKETMRNQLKEMEVNQFKSLKEGKKKSRDRWVRKYLQNYQIKHILNQEE